jgi:hypothetical protein
MVGHNLFTTAIAVLGSVRYSFSQLRPPRLLSAQIHSLAPQIMLSGPLREVGVGGARRVLHSNEIRYIYGISNII